MTKLQPLFLTIKRPLLVLCVLLMGVAPGTVSAQFTSTSDSNDEILPLLPRDLEYIDQKEALRDTELVLTSCVIAPDSVLPGRNNQERAYNYFVERGLRPEQAAGAVGNIIASTGEDLGVEGNDPAAFRTGLDALWDTGFSSLADQPALENEFSESILTQYGSAGASSSDSNPVQECIDAGTGEVVGEYSLPVNRSVFDQRPQYLSNPHHGTNPAVDIGVPTGVPVYSVTDGTVTGGPVGGNCGIGVQVTTDDGVSLVYCHGTNGGSVEGARVGDRVSAGQYIMSSGNTGRSTGPHLHLGIRVNGTLVCPQPLLQAIYNRQPADIRTLPSSGCNSGEILNI